MFGFSPAELLFTAVVIIIFTDPKDLPALSRKAAAFIKKIRSFTREFTDVVNKELVEPKSYIKDLKGEMQKTYDIDELKTPSAIKPVIPAKAGILAEELSETQSKDSRLRGNDK